MNSPDKIQEAARHVQAEWSRDRADYVKEAVQQKLHQRAVRKKVVAGSGVAALCVAGLWLALSSTPSPTAPEKLAVTAAPERPRDKLQLADGSSVRPLADDADFELTQQNPEQVTVQLRRGGVALSVTSNEKRQVSVVVAQMEVRVIGTVFEVERNEDQVQVRVEEGTVEVLGEDSRRKITAGEEETFDLQGRLQRRESATVTPKRKRKRSPDRWRDLAQSGHFKSAARALVNKDARVNASVDDMMLAADALRLGGYHEEALKFLNRVQRQHGRDPRAPLASFTRGRILLNQLGRPREAAAAFEIVRRRYPTSSLAEDALAREVEAWSTAGETVRARELARDYLRRYPKGHRRRQVERFGGLP